MPPRRYLAIGGGVAGACAVALSHMLTNLLNTRATPVQAVAEAIIEITPGGLAEFFIQLVGQNDKPILVAGTTIGVILFGVLSGLLAARSRLLANLVPVLVGILGLAALLAGPGFTSATMIPLAAGIAAWLVVLAVLVDVAGKVTSAKADPWRRGFLLRAGGFAVAALVVGASGQFFGRSLRAVETSRRLLRLPVRRGSVPAAATLDVPDVEPWRTPNPEFYRIDTALVLPTIDPNEWRLRIHGLVDHEMTLTYGDLLDREVTEAWVTLCCVSNQVGGDLIGNAWWSGVRIADILAEAGVSPEADAVLQTSDDGWNCGTPLEALTDGRNAMLAVAMNGRPLPIEHGFPVRMVVPGLYGFVSATKWLVDLEVTRFDRFTAYWTERGWSPRGPVKTQSRIGHPRDGAKVLAGQVRVGGYAWAQHTGVEAVEIRLDGGAWQPAELGGVPNGDTWVQWAASVDVPPGDHLVAVRATDKSGYTQTGARTDVVPDGATGWHTVDFTAV
jgi:DMSO/TMAO reductase YedYZ molybdopterin-dependent catalytic subunit